MLGMGIRILETTGAKLTLYAIGNLREKIQIGKELINEREADHHISFQSPTIHMYIEDNIRICNCIWMRKCHHVAVCLKNNAVMCV